MKKRLLSFVIAVFISLSSGLMAYADDSGFVVDLENKVSDETSLELKAQEIFDIYKIAVTYLKSTSLDGMTGAEYAQHMYSQYIDFPDAILLVDCAEASTYYMHYAGMAAEIFQAGDGNAMMAAYDAAPTYDDGVRDYLRTAENILSQRNISRDLVLLDDESESIHQIADTETVIADDSTLLTFDEPQQEINPTPQAAPAIPADRQLPLVVDTAGVLDPSLVETLNSKAEALSEKYKCEIAAVFVNTTGASSPQAYADDFYDYNGYGYGSGDDGIILMVAAEDRSFAISTFGSAAYSFTDYGQVYMDEKYVPYLRNNDWGGAANAYLDVCAELLEYEVRNGFPYDISYEEPESSVITGLVFSLFIGFVLAFIPVGFMKRKMLNVQKKHDAADYLRPGSFDLTRRHDRFITSHVTRTPIPKNDNNSRGGGGGGSSFHISSSGRSHGGHSGRF